MTPHQRALQRVAELKRQMERMNRLYTPGWEDYAGNLQRAYADEQKRHRSLLGIHEVEHTSSEPIEDRLKRLGYSDYEPVRHNFIIDRDETDQTGYDGGSVCLLRRGTEPVQTICFMRRRVEVERYDGMMLWAFFHEMGHVDDFEKQKHLVLGRTALDETQIELYAHRYAFKRLMGLNYRFIMRIYIDALVTDLAVEDHVAARQAARLFLHSGEFKNYLSFVTPIYKATGDEVPDFSSLLPV